MTRKLIRAINDDAYTHPTESPLQKTRRILKGLSADRAYALLVTLEAEAAQRCHAEHLLDEKLANDDR